MCPRRHLYQRVDKPCAGGDGGRLCDRLRAGFAIEILNEDEARDTMKLFDDIEESYRESLEADPAD